MSNRARLRLASISHCVKEFLQIETKSNKNCGKLPKTAGPKTALSGPKKMGGKGSNQKWLRRSRYPPGEPSATNGTTAGSWVVFRDPDQIHYFILAEKDLKKSLKVFPYANKALIDEYRLMGRVVGRSGTKVEYGGGGGGSKNNQV